MLYVTSSLVEIRVAKDINRCTTVRLLAALEKIHVIPGP